MKNYLLLFISILLLTSLQLRAQVYHSFPDSDARWSEESYVYGAQPGGQSVDNYNGWAYTLGNDTVIDSIHYTLLGYQKTWSFSESNGDPNTDYATNTPLNPPGAIFGAIREDSSKKIWFKRLPSGNLYLNCSCFQPFSLPVDTEVILYDFNAHVGDTLFWARNSWNYFWKTVTAIDSVQLLDGSFRKRFKINFPNWGEEYWIEGIGSTLGLFGGAFQLGPNSQYWQAWGLLNCFSQNDQYLFEKDPEPSTVACDAISITGIQNLSTSSTSSLFPNPFTTATTLQFKLTTNSLTSLQLYDVNGKEIKSLLNNESLSAGLHSITIDAGNYLPGIYYYMLRCGEKTEVGKMVLMQ